MARQVDLTKLKEKSRAAVTMALNRLAIAEPRNDYTVIRWMSAMTLVELHAVWERYAEQRLVAALNHSPTHFIELQGLTGVSSISSGFAAYIVRGGDKFFDFRSAADLLKKGDRWLGANKNPFRATSKHERDYLDAVAAIRNNIVHQSEASKKSYTRHLKTTYNITYPPAPEEFLNAVDNRSSAPMRYKSRIQGLASIISDAIEKC